jgi:hypothetical protein
MDCGISQEFSSAFYSALFWLTVLITKLGGNTEYSGQTSNTAIVSPRFQKYRNQICHPYDSITIEILFVRLTHNFDKIIILE